mmetsp:Transcript_25119/g.72508  ORF Transcript_25119/g.72508 Transcript_25119/m.72508 type:complete len:204 (-) Transcript_25119:16-627(-)
MVVGCVDGPLVCGNTLPSVATCTVVDPSACGTTKSLLCVMSNLPTSMRSPLWPTSSPSATTLLMTCWSMVTGPFCVTPKLRSVRAVSTPFLPPACSARVPLNGGTSMSVTDTSDRGPSVSRVMAKVVCCVTAARVPSAAFMMLKFVLLFFNIVHLKAVSSPCTDAVMRRSERAERERVREGWRTTWTSRQPRTMSETCELFCS